MSTFDLGERFDASTYDSPATMKLRTFLIGGHVLGNVLFNATTGFIMMLFMTLKTLCDNGDAMETLVITWKVCAWGSLFSIIESAVFLTMLRQELLADLKQHIGNYFKLSVLFLCFAIVFSLMIIGLFCFAGIFCLFDLKCVRDLCSNGVGFGLFVSIPIMWICKVSAYTGNTKWLEECCTQCCIDLPEAMTVEYFHKHPGVKHMLLKAYTRQSEDVHGGEGP